jgi:4-aminobutyrate aminotransferase / (S)-3-amino-2-methylpropionate transaminase / 5-aminovalerate transaminase
MMDWIAEQGMKGDLKVAGKKYGLVLDVGGYHKNVITLAPSLLITKEETDLALNLLDQLFTRAKKQ